MAQTDALIDARDIPAALGFLSRLPIPVDGTWAVARGARSAWAYPVAGLVLGAAVAGAAAGLLALGLPAGLAAALAIALSLLLTGALHEDGLADCCDGFWGGWTPERRRDIMKDSRIGAYGVLGLMVALLARWSAYSALLDAGWIAIAIPVAAASRAAMVALMALPNARPGGVSAAVGRPPFGTIALACAIGGLCLAPLGASAIVVIMGITAAAAAVARTAMAKIGGQTGDVLGATQQVTEIAGLAAILALLP